MSIVFLTVEHILYEPGVLGQEAGRCVYHAVLREVVVNACFVLLNIAVGESGAEVCRPAASNGGSGSSKEPLTPQTGSASFAAVIPLLFALPAGVISRRRKRS